MSCQSRLPRSNEVLDIINPSLYNLSLPHYKHSVLMPFEDGYDLIQQIRWLRRFKNFGFPAVVCYCFVITFLYYYMKPFPRMNLRTSVFLWNFGLFLFSLVAVARVLPDLFYDLWYYGFEYTVCDASWVLVSPVTGFWIAVFAYSKIVEFGDTVFLVLRKRPLTVLHVYHHISVVLSVFYLITKQMGPARYVVVVNGSIHTIMYAYFALKTLDWKIPLWVSITITVIQIGQMLFGILVAVTMNLVLWQGRKCSFLYEDIALVVFLAVSYTALFCNYFYQTYVKKAPKKPTAKKVQ